MKKEMKALYVSMAECLEVSSNTTKETVCVGVTEGRNKAGVILTKKEAVLLRDTLNEILGGGAQ